MTFLSELHGRIGQLLAEHGDARVVLDTPFSLRKSEVCVYVNYTDGRLDNYLISVPGLCEPINVEDAERYSEMMKKLNEV